MSTKTKTIVCYALCGDLYEYDTGAYIRPVTEAERAQSEHASLINARAVFEVEIEEFDKIPIDQ